MNQNRIEGLEGTTLQDLIQDRRYGLALLLPLKAWGLIIH